MQPLPSASRCSGEHSSSVQAFPSSGQKTSRRICLHSPVAVSQVPFVHSTPSSQSLSFRQPDGGLGQSDVGQGGRGSGGRTTPLTSMVTNTPSIVTPGGPPMDPVDWMNTSPSAPMTIVDVSTPNGSSMNAKLSSNPNPRASSLIRNAPISPALVCQSTW